MKIRTYQPGDEFAQVAIYNTAAGGLAKFKPATLQEVQRRVRAKDFDPGQRFFAEEHNQVVGYCNFTANGRVSYPWHLPGKESVAGPLFETALAAMNAGGLGHALAAYRDDWPVVLDFFRARGFRHVRDMVNYLVDFHDLPTTLGRANPPITPARPEDVDQLYALYPAALGVNSAAALAEHLFRNPYFPPEALFVLRSRQSHAPMALGLLITASTYADPRAVDPAMPCFRLGAFGAETMTAKRIRGLFSFLARPEASLPSLAMDLLNHAVQRLEKDDPLDCLAAQVPSDAPALQTFYDRHFRKQGSFPVFELALR